MKIWKKVLTSVLSAVMTFTLLSAGVCAADPYTYTVTFYPGNHGSFNEAAVPTVNNISNVTIVKTAEKITVSGLSLGDTVGLNAQPSVTLEENSKYYAKGIRLSGRDNNTVDAAAFVVNGDADYVVAYGIKGEQVKYTVQYVHENGKVLAAEETFYGNVGDKPVVAYKYIEGYNPKMLGLTKTLSADESENVFKFVYVNATSPTIRDVVTEDISYNETVITIGGGTTATGGGAGGATNVTGGGAGNEDANTAGGAGAEGAGEGEGTGGDNLIVDLDEETPLANIDAEGNENGNMAPMALYIGMGLLAIIAIIAAVYISKKLKKNEEA